MPPFISTHWRDTPAMLFDLNRRLQPRIYNNDGISIPVSLPPRPDPHLTRHGRESRGELFTGSQWPKNGQYWNAFSAFDCGIGERCLCPRRQCSKRPPRSRPETHFSEILADKDARAGGVYYADRLSRHLTQVMTVRSCSSDN